MRVPLLAVLAAGCTVPLVPTERTPIEWVRNGTHGHYEKGGVQLLGTTCGEQYHRAVAGVPEAEELVDSCERFTIGYGIGMGVFVAGLASAGVFEATLDGSAQKSAATASLATAITGFAVGLVMARFSIDRMARAVHVYNRGG